MGALTEDVPKGLNTLAGRTLIEWQCHALVGAGTEAPVAVGGYRTEKLAEFVPAAYVNARWQETNMVRSLACAAPLLETGVTCVSYSDIVYHPALVRALIAADGDIVMTYDQRWQNLWTLRFEDPLSDAETFRSLDGRLIEIGAKADSYTDIEGQFMGLFKFTPAGWRRVAEYLATLPGARVDRLDITSLFAELVAKGATVHTVAIDGCWCEVDSESDLRKYDAALHDTPAGERWSHDWRT